MFPWPRRISGINPKSVSKTACGAPWSGIEVRGRRAGFGCRASGIGKAARRSYLSLFFGETAEARQPNPASKVHITLVIYVGITGVGRVEGMTLSSMVVSRDWQEV